MATIRKRNNKYQVQVRVKGQFASDTFVNLNHARSWIRQKEIELEGRVLGKRYKPKTMLEILNEYKTKITPLKKSSQNEIIIINALIKHKWIHKPLASLCSSDVARYRDVRLQTIKASSFAREFCILKHALKVAEVEWNWNTPNNLLGNIKIPKVRSKAIRRIDDIDLERLLKAAAEHRNQYLKPIIILALETAMRRGEILSLKWSDIDMHRGLIIIDNTKTGFPRSIQMNDKVRSVLTSLNELGEQVFPISVNSLRLCYQRLCKKLGIKVRFHDFRHEAISRLFEQNLSIPHIASISGHRTMSQLFRYAHFKVSANAS